MTPDEIINSYRASTKMEKNAQFRELSNKFHAVFRQAVAWGEHRKLITSVPQTPNFWKDLIDSAPDK